MKGGDNMTNNQRVKEIRTTLGMTLESFGAKLNVTKVAISNIEKEKNNLSERMIIDICREFNVNETWLRTGNGEMFEQRPIEQEIALFARKIINYGSDSFRARFITALSKLDESEWNVLEKIADEMINNSKEGR